MSDPSGAVTITPTTAGSFTLRASKTGDAPSAPFAICVHNGNDGTCGTSAAASGAPTGQSSGSVLGYSSAPYKGPYAVVASLAGLLDSHRYPRGRAPRTLAGKVLAHTTVTSVSLRLRRS